MNDSIRPITIHCTGGERQVYNVQTLLNGRGIDAQVVVLTDIFNALDKQYLILLAREHEPLDLRELVKEAPAPFQAFFGHPPKKSKRMRRQHR